jgi:hypothetical protein
MKKPMLAPMRSPAMESNNDDAEVQSAKIQAVYLDKQNVPIRSVYNVGPCHTLRQKIMGLSLFPNIYNRSMLVRHG